MKNKNFILNEEVIRILEMMNIESKKSKLLTESIVDDIAKGIIRLSVKSGDDVATSLSKIEREFGVPKGTLNSGDIAKLSTQSDASGVVIKIVDNLSPKQLKIFADKVWTQLPEAQNATKNVIDNLVTSKKTYTSDNLLKYLNDKSEIAINSPVPELDPLIKSLRKEFVDRSYKSLEGKGVIDDVAGSAGKVGNEVKVKIDDIIDAALGDKSLKKILPNVSDADLTLMRESIQSKYGKMSIDDVSTDFIRIRDEFMSQVKKITDDGGNEVLVKVQNGKKFEIKNTKWLYDNKITRMCVGKSTYINQTTGAMVDKMDPKWLKIGQCITAIWALGELYNHFTSEPNEREFLGCKVLSGLGGFCGSDLQTNNGFCVKSCSGSKTETSVSEIFTNDYAGCMSWAKSIDKICEKDDSGAYIIYDEITPDVVTPVSYDVDKEKWGEI
jgi:hypothetical protein